MCISPQAYDDAMVRVRETNGRDLEPLKKELGEKQQCMFVALTDGLEDKRLSKT